jgi:hypothetical protein
MSASHGEAENPGTGRGRAHGRVFSCSAGDRGGHNVFGHHRPPCWPGSAPPSITVIHSGLARLARYSPGSRANRAGASPEAARGGGAGAFSVALASMAAILATETQRGDVRADPSACGDEAQARHDRLRRGGVQFDAASHEPYIVAVSGAGRRRVEATLPISAQETHVFREDLDLYAGCGSVLICWVNLSNSSP